MKHKKFTINNKKSFNKHLKPYIQKTFCRLYILHLMCVYINHDFLPSYVQELHAKGLPFIFFNSTTIW